MKRLRLFALALAAALIATAAPGPALAQGFLRGPSRFATPQHFALELRFGPYSPDVDDEFDGAANPHEQLFGKKRRLMSQVEFDYQFLHAFGSLGLGAQLGYFREKARAFKIDGGGAVSTERSGDKTRLVLAPVALLAVYRLDEGVKRWNFPLVPYVKAGLNYTFWWIYDGNDEVAHAGGGRGRGGSLGWQGAAGLAFLLDIIDTGAAVALDQDSGINHTYAFFEFNKTSSPAFGNDKTLHVGDSTWTAGLAFEF